MSQQSDERAVLEADDSPLCELCGASVALDDDTLCSACRRELDDTYADLPGAEE